nr:RNA-directed DNA polymerase, eukaryota, reverse transcriptase zinc-binding domain protein [Tanacetum cinerariifolium]
MPNKFDDTIFYLNNKKGDDGIMVSTDVGSVDGVQTYKSRETIEIEETSKEDEIVSVNESRDRSLMVDNCDVNFKEYDAANKLDASSCSKSDSNSKSTIKDEILRKKVNETGKEVFDEEGQIKNSKDIDVCLDKREPAHIPIWVRMCNIHLEAWTTSGISAVANRLGKPLVMDTITTEICKKGLGRVKYVRVLVKVHTSKCIPEEIKVVYMDKDKMEICRKKFIVKFDWIPLRCSKCCIFGHDMSSCGKFEHEKPNAVNLDESNTQDKKKENDANRAINDGFINEKNVEMKDSSQSPRRDVTNENCQGISTSSPAGCWNIKGLCTYDKQNKLRKFMKDERLSIYAIIETRIKAKKLLEIRNGIFKQWELINNMRIEDKREKLLIFCSVVYAANRGNKRRDLWKELSLYNRIVADSPWAILGDTNVTLDLGRRLASSGLFYTWIKNLHKTKQGDNTSILKKLDRAMRNEAFICEYSRNRVNTIHDERGTRFEGDKVAEQFVNHFKQFLGENFLVNKLQGYNELFKKKLRSEEAVYMVREEFYAKIKKAMFMIDENKAPIPDGYTLCFFKKAWNIIGNDVCQAVRGFFKTRRNLSEINTTLIALVPKIQTPAKVSDYRPIACCNVIYKCISKVLTERLKKCLGKLVSQNQSASIPNRQIQYNILISQVLLKVYDRKNGPKRVALKIDLQKAYDTVNWNFLEDILNGFGFHEK